MVAMAGALSSSSSLRSIEFFPWSATGARPSTAPHLIFNSKRPPLLTVCSASSSSRPPPSTAAAATISTAPSHPGPVVRKRKRYRKPYPGETSGIVQEMRFVAMKLRSNPKTDGGAEEERDGGGDGEGETWQASMEGFLKYLVDSKLVFDAVERIVDESTDVAYVYFRKTGLERSERLSKDLEWFNQQGISIPQPSTPGTAYVAYLNDLAEKSAPSFLCHFYNIYFAHMTGGQEIGKKVCDMLLEGRELEFYKWDNDEQDSLKGVRENLNKLGEHWSRDVKNACLREAAKSFRFLGQIVRLIIL